MTVTDQEVEAALKAFYPRATPGPWPMGAKELMRDAIAAAYETRALTTTDLS